MFLPLLIFPCTLKSRSSLLAPADPGGPEKRAVKRLWCGGYQDILRYELSQCLVIIIVVVTIVAVRGWLKKQEHWLLCVTTLGHNFTEC